MSDLTLGPIDDELLLDRVVFVAAVDGQDVSGGPIQGDGALSPEIPAIVSKLQFRQTRGAEQGTVHATDLWTILTNIDPRPYGVERSDQPIRWTQHDGSPVTSTVGGTSYPYEQFILKGDVELPGGLLSCFMMSVERVS